MPVLITNETIKKKKPIYKKINHVYFYVVLLPVDDEDLPTRKNIPMHRIEWYNAFSDKNRRDDEAKSWKRRGYQVFSCTLKINKKPVPLNHEGQYWVVLGMKDNEKIEISAYNVEADADWFFKQFTGYRFEYIIGSKEFYNSPYWGSWIFHLDGLDDIGW